jgi:hypothetical protein
MKRRFSALLLFVLIFLPPTFGAAGQGSSSGGGLKFSFQPYWLYDVMNFLFKPVVPYSNLRDIIFFAIIPFLLVFTVVYGILIELNIFKRKNIKIVLAFLFALSLMYYGVLSHIVSVIAGLGSFAVFLIFALTFIVGAWFLGKARRGEWKTKADNFGLAAKHAKELKKELEHIHEELRLVRENMSEFGVSSRELNKLKEKEEKLQKQAIQIRKEIAEAINKTEVLKDEVAFGD